MKKCKVAYENAKEDLQFVFEQSSRPLPKRWLAHCLASRSVRAAFWFRACAQSHGILHLLIRNHVMKEYACDVSSGATIGCPLYIPHPVGIVIGIGVVVEDRVRIYQHVTLGRDGNGSYPHIGQNVTLYPQAIIFGGAVVPHGQKIAAGSILSPEGGRVG